MTDSHANPYEATRAARLTLQMEAIDAILEESWSPAMREALETVRDQAEAALCDTEEDHKIDEYRSRYGIEGWA